MAEGWPRGGRKGLVTAEMEWKTKFSSTIRERGKRYYLAGNVKNFKQEGTRIQATVKGTKSYRVTIETDGSRILDMYCSCPYAEDGTYCKHMAAVLYEMEARQNQDGIQQQMDFGKQAAEEAAHADTPARVSGHRKGAANPASSLSVEPTGNASEYTYFDYNAMCRQFKMTAAFIKRAKSLVADGKVSLLKVDFGYKRGTGQEEMIGVATGRYKEDKTNGRLVLTFNRNQILEANCGVAGCYNNYIKGRGFGSKALCSHEAALLLLVGDYIRENRPGDATDRSGAEFLAMYRGLREAKMASAADAGLSSGLNLVPRLTRQQDGFSVAFRIGSGKLFVIKNLTDLVQRVRNGETATYGTATKINHSIDNFTERGKEYLKFIENAVDEELEREARLYSRASYYYRDQRMTIAGAIPLFGSRLDDFYDVLRDDSLEFIDGYGSEKTKITLSRRDQAPGIRLKIEKNMDGGIFQGITVSGALPDLLYGQRAAYYLDDQYLNRVSAQLADELLPLEQMGTAGRLEFKIGRKRLGEFYYTMLPWLRSHASVEDADAESVGEYLPPEVRFVFYLDAEGRNATCRAEAEYGEERFSLADGLEEDHGEELESYRDGLREKEAQKTVLQYFPFVDAKTGQFHCGEDEELIYEVLEHGVSRLLELGEVQSTPAFGRLNIQKRPKISVGVSVESELMNLSISTEDMSAEELLDALLSYRKKKRFYRLRNGDFLKLESEGIETLSLMLEGLHLAPKELIKGKMQIPAYRALYLDKMLEAGEELYTNRDRRFKKMIKEFKTVSDSDFEVPDTLKMTLRKYQEAGYKWLRTLDEYNFGGILADDMGLGKTLQVITVLLAAKEEGRKGVSLIVAPASLVYNWGEEFARFAPALKVCLVTGTQQERRKKMQSFQEWDVLVTSYDLLKRDIAEYEELTFSYEILDEAQYIKNHSTAASKAVKVIKSRTKFALTGTPIENRLSELWSIFDYLMPGFLYGYDVFKKETETPIVKNKDEKATARLKQMVSPFILRRLKGEVLKDLPDKLEEIRYAKLEEKQQKLYDGQVVHMLQVVQSQNDEDFRKNKVQILAELTKIRQICCDPSLCFENYDGESAKREACMDLIRSAAQGEHKMLVFSQFASMLELLEGDLEKERLPYYKITGATPKEKRIQMVKEFNENQVPVFLISLKAGGTGLNLTGADMVIHYDPWWNLAVQNQATDRAHRIGQQKVVTVYRLIVKDSIEEKILHMQEAKKNLADEILSGETGGIGSMSRDELLELFR